jgi:hypothetical protein
LRYTGPMWRRIGWLTAVAVLSFAVCDCGESPTSPVPGSDGYVAVALFADPLKPSRENPGPFGCADLSACVKCCQGEPTQQCRDWIHSIFLALAPENQRTVAGKVNGLWLPTIDAVRAAARQIPVLKAIGINTLSFGPDVVTRDVEVPTTVGDNAFRFYIKVFEDAGFGVHLVPNSMHWGNNDVSLCALTPLVLAWAQQAEVLGVRFFAMLNEVDGMQDSLQETSAWLQEVLPLVRERYSGFVCAQPTQVGFKSGRLDYSGYDGVSTFFSLMGPDSIRNAREVDVFLREARRVEAEFRSIQYVLFSDVSTYSGGNWAETTLIEAQARAAADGRSEYVDEWEQARAIEGFLETAYPVIDGCFLNNWVGFTFTGRLAQQVVRPVFAASGTIPRAATDPLWATPGLLELIEDATVTEFERERIFDYNTYVAGWAGLCYEPTEADPGPFGCTSVLECMERFRQHPDEYWWISAERCGED